jgi:hypothetical protein
MPDDLHARLRALAEQDRRSLNAEILHLLETAADQRERRPRNRPV